MRTSNPATLQHASGTCAYSIRPRHMLTRAGPIKCYRAGAITLSTYQMLPCYCAGAIALHPSKGDLLKAATPQPQRDARQAMQGRQCMPHISSSSSVCWSALQTTVVMKNIAVLECVHVLVLVAKRACGMCAVGCCQTCMWHVCGRMLPALYLCIYLRCGRVGLLLQKCPLASSSS